MKTNYEEITAEIEAKRAKEDAVLNVYRMLDLELEKLSQEKKKLQNLKRIEETEKVINALPAGKGARTIMNHRTMANKPCMGMYRCPNCGNGMPVVWNGNQKINCFSCHKPFTIKRQKMWNVRHVESPKDGGQDDG